MELLNFLKKAIQERYVANATVVALEEEIKRIIIDKIEEEYSKKILTKDGLSFEFLGVKCRYKSRGEDYVFNEEMAVRLYYICTSKVPKDKQLKIDDAKKNYKENGYFPYNNSKVKLWHEFYFVVNFEQFLDDKITLSLSLD